MIRKRSDKRAFEPEEQEFIERVVKINRVAKVVKGGRRFGFTAMVVVGDGNGKVGAGFGKANEVPEAIRKGIEKAKKTMINVPTRNTTIHHEVIGRAGAGRVLLKPASLGTGIVAGSAVRAVMEAAGVRNILSKSLGSDNAVNIVRATINGLRQLRTEEEVAKLRGRDVGDVLTRSETGGG